METKRIMDWKDSEHVGKITFKDPHGWTEYQYPRIVVVNLCSVLSKLSIDQPLFFLILVDMASPVLQGKTIPNEIAKRLLEQGLVVLKREDTYTLQPLVNSIFLEWFEGNESFNFNASI